MFIRYTIAAWVWTIIVLILCLMPGDKMPEDPIVNADKVYHAGVFALMSFLYGYGFKQQNSFPGLQVRAMTIALVWTIFLGGLIEILQRYFVRNRQGDWFDFLFDTLGAIVGTIALVLFYKYRAKRLSINKR